MKDTEELNVVYVRFDKNLDYKEVVNSFPIKKFLETVFGDFPHMVTPKNFEFDREQLGQFAQDEYDMSKEYVVDVKKVPEIITNEYYKTIGEEGEPLFWNKCRFLLCFKYDKKNPYKLIKFIFNSLLRILIKKFNDKNGIYIYKEELEKNKEKELNFEMEETQIKLEISKIILEQIIEETIEILSHIDLNRKNPELYGLKSIYSAIELPKLEFQKEESS